MKGKECEGSVKGGVGIATTIRGRTGVVSLYKAVADEKREERERG